MKARFLGFAFATFLAIGSSRFAEAAFLFDPDGSGSGGAYEVGSFDFLTGNALSDNIAVGENWTLYYQASLGSLVNPTGNSIAGTGLNSNYEITAVAGISVQTTFSNDNTLIFALNPAGDTNFLQLYYDESIDSNALAGTGYNDGTLILDASATNDLQGIFSVFGTALAPLDSFGANDWAGTSSVIGIGAFATTAEVAFANSDFFKLAANEFLSSMFVNSSEVTPYRQTDPSRQFWDGTSFIDSDVGSINGLDGPSALTQADANASFNVEAVPEASSLALLGLASAVFGLGVRHKKLRRAQV